MLTQNDTRAFLMAMNAIADYVPPIMYQRLIANPVSQVLQDVANGVLPPLMPQPQQGEAGPPQPQKPHLVPVDGNNAAG